MPAASSSARAVPSRRRKRAGAATRAQGPAGASRVRWDRVGRTAMLCVLAALVYLYLSAGVHMLSTLRQSHRDSATVATLQREHGNLVRQHKTLSQPGEQEAQARQLGMVKKHERPYVISGLPAN